MILFLIYAVVFLLLLCKLPRAWPFGQWKGTVEMEVNKCLHLYPTLLPKELWRLLT